MNSLVSIDLRKLRASGQPRPLVTDYLDRLAASLRELGLIQPITVRRAVVMDDGIATDGYQIVAGHHRVAAARSLGWVDIPAIVIETDEYLRAELVEIDENLCRSELTVAQRSAAIKRRRQIWEALHPETGRNPPSSGGRGHVSFAADTERATGESKRRTNEHLSRAEALGDDIEAVVGTSLDKGVELDALKSMPEPERKELIQRAKAGEKVSARKPAPVADVEVEQAPERRVAAISGAGGDSGENGAGLAYLSGHDVRDLVALIDKVVDQAMGLRDRSVRQVSEAAARSVPDELRPYFAALAGIYQRQQKAA